MRFEEIMPLLREGRRVRRQAWIKDMYIVIAPDGIMRDEEDIQYLKTHGVNEDIMSDDWEEVSE